MWDVNIEWALVINVGVQHFEINFTSEIHNLTTSVSQQKLCMSSSNISYTLGSINTQKNQHYLVHFWKVGSENENSLYCIVFDCYLHSAVQQFGCILQNIALRDNH